MIKRGLILFAHGARDKLWARPFEQIAHTYAEKKPTAAYRLAYLEFMEPSLARAAEELILEGCQGIDVLPLFLGAGGHVRRDLPQLILEIENKHGININLHPTIGEDPSVVNAIAMHAIQLQNITG